jgi:hypothetical protein
MVVTFPTLALLPVGFLADGPGTGKALQLICLLLECHTAWETPPSGHSSFAHVKRREGNIKFVVQDIGHHICWYNGAEANRSMALFEEEDFAGSCPDHAF